MYYAGSAKYVFCSWNVGVLRYLHACDCDCVLLVDTYDVLVISGGMGEGHIPTVALTEMIRLVKPGTCPM